MVNDETYNLSSKHGDCEQKPDNVNFMETNQSIELVKPAIEEWPEVSSRVEKTIFLLSL